jgi:tetratricopeptide (TPR) repeat protein
MNRQERRKAARPRMVSDTKHLLELTFQQYRQGNLKAAETGLRKVLSIEPNQPDGLRLLGELLSDLRRPAEAIAVLIRLAELHPRNFVTHYTLGNAYRLAGQMEAAISSYKTALALNPDFAGAHHGLGVVLRQTEQEHEAVASFLRSVRAKPDWAVAWKDLGLALAVLGKLDEAEAALERAVSLQPGLGDAQRQLAALPQKAAGPTEMMNLAGYAAQPRLPVDEKIGILFALGRRADKAKLYGEAFPYFAEANRLLRTEQQRVGVKFDRAKLARNVDEMIKAFPAGSFADRNCWGHASAAPVFIVGMPRSGSSLFEQIAASHSQVFGAGERSGIGEIAARIGWEPSGAWAKARTIEEADGYLQCLHAGAGNAARIIDKMPDNIFQLGLIATLFPNARVIFCSRDMRDVSLSCYFQRFANDLAFDTDIADCAFRYRETERLAEHWRQVLPIRHITLSYEAVVACLEGEARRLIDFLGLEWEAQCLDFHRTERKVRTASWAQVRQPLYQESAGRWRHYEAFLEPFLRT